MHAVRAVTLCLAFPWLGLACSRSVTESAGGATTSWLDATVPAAQEDSGTPTYCDGSAACPCADGTTQLGPGCASTVPSCAAACAAHGGQDASARSPDGGADAALSLPADPDLDTPCPADGGPTPREIFALLERQYSATYTPEHGSTGSTALTIGVSVGDGGATCVPATSCSGADPACAPASLSLALNLTFVTSDGTFHETFPATASRGSQGANVAWSGSLPATSLKGAYRVTEGAPADVTLEFEGSFHYPTVGGTFGEVDEETATVSAESGSW